MTTVFDRQTDRQANYDLLRIVSTIAVIFIHVNWNFFGSKYDLHDESLAWVVESIINIITRFSVPCFMMLSGAFLLERHIKAVDFYRRSLKKIFLPTIIVISLLVAYRMVMLVCFGGSTMSVLKSLINGTFYNYWYLYTLFIIYLFAPIIRVVKDRISKKQYYLLTIFMLVWAVISQATSNQSISWNIGVCIAYISYFMAGNVLKEAIESGAVKKKYRIPCIIIILICVTISYLFRVYVSNYYTYRAYASFLSPSICVMSISTFIIFGTTNVRINCSWLAKKTFYIYLFHTFCMNIIFMVFPLTETPELLTIVISSIMVFAFAFLCALLFEYGWHLVVKKTRINDRLNKLRLWTFVEH